jgi:hypothetical protein
MKRTYLAVVSLTLAAAIHPVLAQEQRPSDMPASPAAVASDPQTAFGVLPGRWVHRIIPKTKELDRGLRNRTAHKSRLFDGGLCFNDNGHADLVGNRCVDVGFYIRGRYGHYQRIARRFLPAIEMLALVPPAHRRVDSEMPA